VHVVGDLHRADVREGDANVLGLSTLVAAGRVRIAEHAARDVAVRVGVLAISRETALAVKAAAAGDVEGHDDAIALAQRGHAAAGLLHHAGEFVPERASDARIRDVAVQEMEVGAADGGSRHLEDDVVGMLDPGIGLAGDLDLVRSLIAQCAHLGFPSAQGHRKVAD